MNELSPETLAYVSRLGAALGMGEMEVIDRIVLDHLARDLATADGPRMAVEFSRIGDGAPMDVGELIETLVYSYRHNGDAR